DDGAVSAGGGGDPGCRDRRVGGLHEHDVGPAGVVGGRQVGDVGDHERIARRRGEFLYDADHVEGDDVEAPTAVVEHAQAQQVAKVQRVVGDRLLGDEDPIVTGVEPSDHLGGGAT